MQVWRRHPCSSRPIRRRQVERHVLQPRLPRAPSESRNTDCDTSQIIRCEPAGSFRALSAAAPSPVADRTQPAVPSQNSAELPKYRDSRKAESAVIRVLPLRIPLTRPVGILMSPANRCAGISKGFQELLVQDISRGDVRDLLHPQAPFFLKWSSGTAPSASASRLRNDSDRLW